MTGLQLDFEAADSITLSNLKFHRDIVRGMMEKHAQGAWMHLDDIGFNVQLINALDRIISYFGGDNE